MNDDRRTTSISSQSSANLDHSGYSGERAAFVMKSPYPVSNNLRQPARQAFQGRAAVEGVEVDV